MILIVDASTVRGEPQPAVSPDSTKGPDPAAVGLRLAELGGTLLAVGALTVTGGVLTALGTTGASLRRRILSIGALGAVATLVAVAATPSITGSGRGLSWVTRLAALCTAAGALWSARRESHADGWLKGQSVGAAGARARRALVVAGCAVLVSVSLDAWRGHASTLPARSMLAGAAATLHVLSAGVWAGGLLVLVFAVVPLMRLDAATRRAVSPAAWRAFSPIAAVSSVVLIATGIYQSGRYVDSVATLWRSVYGTAVMAKTLLLLVALALAAYNTLVVNRPVADRVRGALGRGRGWRPRRGRLATTVTVESAVLVIALAVAALLTSVPTAREVTHATVPSPIGSATVDGLFITFEAVPSGEQVRLAVRVQPVVRPVRAPVTGADVELRAASPSSDARTALERVGLRAVEPGHYEGTADRAAATAWTARILVHRAGLPDAAAVVPWSSEPEDTTSPLEIAATGLSALLLAAVAGVMLLVRRRRRATPLASPERLATSAEPGAPPADGVPKALPASPPMTPIEELSRR